MGTCFTGIVIDAFIGLAVLSGGACAQDGEPFTSTIHLQVFGPLGGPAYSEKEVTHVRITSASRVREDYSDHVHGLVILEIPAGEYVLDVADSAGSEGHRTVRVNAEDLWVKVGLRAPRGDGVGPGGDLNINGEIKPVPRVRDDWWVRVEGLYLDFRREAPILAEGRFSIDGLDQGAYVFQVFRGDKLYFVETVAVRPGWIEVLSRPQRGSIAVIVREGSDQ